MAEKRARHGETGIPPKEAGQLALFEKEQKDARDK